VHLGYAEAIADLALGEVAVEPSIRNDYVTWTVFGMACLGGIFALVIR
jgi:hypothetical protein